MNGFINLLKPPGMTSQDAVSRVKRLLPRGTSVGHGGTLDPDAAGVLPICVGRATRLFDYIVDKRKEYIGELALGVSTDTCDSSGHIIEQSACLPGRAEVEKALASFVGDIMQVPPEFSACKVDGKRAYLLMRKGKDVELKAKPLHIDEIELLAFSPEDMTLTIRVVCGKGTYIRALARDIGADLQSGAFLTQLRRTRVGQYHVDEAIDMDDFPQWLDHMLNQ